MFVTYLTIYEGDLLPPFYIGSTTAKRIGAGYRGSVRSKQYRAIWEQELATNPDLFDTIVLDEFETREESLLAELELQKKHNVVSSPMFVNMGLAKGGFVNRGSEMFTPEIRAKMSASAKARGMSKALMEGAARGRIGRVNSEETKAKRIATQKATMARKKAAMTIEELQAYKLSHGNALRGKPWPEARRAAYLASKEQ